MAITYRAGYAGARMTLAELRAWDRFSRLAPELQRRLVAVMDAARAAGTDLGIGGGYRYPAEQERLFLERHEPVTVGGCCGWNGRRYNLRAGLAHAAPPGRSYHEIGLAVDLLGWENGWFEKNAAAYGLRTFASLVNNREPWHAQPVEIATSRAAYDPVTQALKTWALPAAPAPAPAPYGSWPRTAKPTIRLGSEGDVVRYLERVLVEKAGQSIANPDRYFRADTDVAVKNLQRFFGLTVDGIVGAQTWPTIDFLAGR